jgi:biopolymer transport protein TolR
MGASVKRPARGARHRPMGEINVTPFVDVMLVLLIVFMVTAPLLTVGVEVDLPKTQAGQVNADAAPLVVSMKANGSLYLQEAEVDIDALIPRLQAVSEANSDIRIFVRGDAAVTYGDILGVMGRIQAAGFSKVALVAKLPEIE